MCLHNDDFVFQISIIRTLRVLRLSKYGAVDMHYLYSPVQGLFVAGEAVYLRATPRFPGFYMLEQNCLLRRDVSTSLL